jgi:IS30 family transposase
MGLLTVRNIDLRRKVKYKLRTNNNKKKDRKKVTHRMGRSYEDYTSYISENPHKEVVQMDTVIGKKGGKTLLTLFFTKSSQMLGILLNKCTQDCVTEAFDKIYDEIGPELFKSTFPVLLTDNGSEFLDAKKIEYATDGERRTTLFFCDPMASYQKGHLEKNHEFIRYVIPKGTSMDHLTQEKITLLMNHINSVSRKSLNNTTPYKLSKLLINKQVLEALSFDEIHPDDVHLKEELLDPTLVKKTLLDIIK